MSFPLNYQGKITCDCKTELTSDQFQLHFLREMADAIVEAKGGVSVNGNRVAFTGGLFRFVSNWNILVPITRGYVETNEIGDELIVSYSINFHQLLAMMSIFIVVVLSFLAIGEEPIGIEYAIPVFIYLFVFGLNYLLTIIRFPAFVKQVLKRV